MRETMLESLFQARHACSLVITFLLPSYHPSARVPLQACGSATGTEKGLGLEAALRVLRDAKGAGLLTPQKQQVN